MVFSSRQEISTEKCGGCGLSTAGPAHQSIYAFDHLPNPRGGGGEMLNLTSAALLAAVPTSIMISGVALWYSVRKRKQSPRRSESEVAAEENKVLFFPDHLTAQSFSTPSSNVVFDEGSLSVLLETLHGAKRSIDVCIFAFSCKELGDVLIDAHHNGVVVRVIADNEQATVSGSQIGKLRKKGIQVRTDDSSYFMHHKFAVVDEGILLSGSLNWTLQGVCGNQENVLITAVPDLVAPFIRQFEKLWEKYDPEKN